LGRVGLIYTGTDKGETQRRIRIGDFEKMLRMLADEVAKRVDYGKWQHLRRIEEL
jgi:hypothetical protein